MNERIDKLIEQCTRQNFSDCVGGYETFDKERFAELIIQECAYLVNDYQRTKGYTNHAEMLCEKFGIEFKEEDYYGDSE